MSLTNLIERFSGDDTSGFSRKNFLFAFLILLTRIPFLFSGFGTDEDSWGVALTALNIHDTFQYEVSRFPGFPVHEIISALFISGGAAALNFLTAVMSSLAVLFFVCALQQMRFRYPYLAGIAFAFTPVVFMHSADTIDYMWAMAFLMLSFLLILQNNILLSAIILAVATGCRITSLAMLMPYCILLIDKNSDTRKNAVVIARYAAMALACSVIIYLPVILKYGNAFFTFYDLSGYPTISKVLYKFSFGVWGILGCAAIFYGIASLLFSSPLKAKRFLLPKTTNEKHVIAWLVAIDLTIIIFVRLPYESGYLIPIIPFTILVFGKYLHDKAFIYFSLLLIASPWLLGVSTQNKSDSPPPAQVSAQFKLFSQSLNIDFFRGAVCTDAEARKTTDAFADSVIQEAQYISDTSVILCGWWSTKVMYKYALLPDEEKNKMITWGHYLSKDELIGYVQKRYHIFYLPMQDSLEKKLYGIDIKYFGAVPLFETEPEETPEELKPES
ncbi:MAG TPA: hypothetical protein VI757_08075 [Bacteroidia bacterium]|nr:hypothetical protein [Bacteroidia bacterium]